MVPPVTRSSHPVHHRQDATLGSSAEICEADFITGALIEAHHRLKGSLQKNEQQTREKHERACVDSGDSGPRSGSAYGFCSFRDKGRATVQQHQGVPALQRPGLTLLAGQPVPDSPGRRRQRGQSPASFRVRWRAQPRRLWTLLYKQSN